MTHVSIRPEYEAPRTTNHRKALAETMIGAVVIATIAGCVPPDTTTSSRHGSTPAWGSASSPTAPATTAAPLPIPADFVVGVIITEQQCFGSAGCNYHYTIDPQYISTKPLPDKTTVIFTVTGGDQDQIGNFTIDKDGMATFDRETMISGPEGAGLHATVPQVLPGRGAH
jgi:hypothetical protein